MKILLVDAFDGTDLGRRLGREFRRAVMTSFHEFRGFKPIFEMRDVEDLQEYIYDPSLGNINFESLARFDVLDFIMVGSGGERCLEPWMINPRARALLSLTKFCFWTNKCLFGSGAMPSFLSYVASTAGANINVLNHHRLPSKHLKDLLAKRKIPLSPRDVYLDYDTGDLYRWDIVETRWRPFANTGMQHCSLVQPHHVQDHYRTTRLNKLTHVPCPAKSFEVRCHIPGTLQHHWANRQINKAFFVCPSRTLWYANARSNKRCTYRFKVLMQADGDLPMVLEFQNMLVAQFDLDQRVAAETRTVLSNFVRHKMNLLLEVGRFGRTSAIVLDIPPQTDTFLLGGIPVSAGTLKSFVEIEAAEARYKQKRIQRHANAISPDTISVSGSSVSSQVFGEAASMSREQLDGRLNQVEEPSAHYRCEQEKNVTTKFTSISKPRGNCKSTARKKTMKANNNRRPTRAVPKSLTSNSHRHIGDTIATVVRSHSNNNSNQDELVRHCIGQSQTAKSGRPTMKERPHTARARVESTPGGRLVAKHRHTLTSYHNMPRGESRDKERPKTSRVRNKPPVLLPPQKEMALVIGDKDMEQAKNHAWSIARLNAILGKPLALAPRRQSPRSPRRSPEGIKFEKELFGLPPGPFSPFHHTSEKHISTHTQSKKRLSKHSFDLHVNTGVSNTQNNKKSSPASRLVSPRPQPFSAWSRHEQERAKRPPVLGFASIAHDGAPFVSREERRVAEINESRTRWVGGAATPFQDAFGAASTRLRKEAGITWDGPYLPPANHDFRELKSPKTPWMY